VLKAMLLVAYLRRLAREHGRLDSASKVKGSWWDNWVAWAAKRSGAMVAPPRLPAGEPAPGSYVRDAVPVPFVAQPAHQRASATRRRRRDGHVAPKGRRTVRRKVTSTAGTDRSEPAATPAPDAVDTGTLET
jgi:hypothetical protein